MVAGRGMQVGKGIGAKPPPAGGTAAGGSVPPTKSEVTKGAKPEPAKPVPAAKPEPTLPHTDPNLSEYRKQTATIRADHDTAIDKGGLARDVGMTPEQYKSHLNGKMKEAVDSGDMYVRVSAHVLPNILEDGRWKTQFETGKSNGSFDPAQRKKTEAKMFGTRPDAGDAVHPVYGYVSGKNFSSAGTFDELSVGGYGNVVVKLKPHVKDRATVTAGDSLTPGKTFNGSSPASSANSTSLPISGKGWKKDHKEFMGAKDGDSFRQLVQKKMGYMEAQVHGGLKVEDIAEIAFGKDPDPNVAKHLKKLGIPYKVTKTSAF